jgi:sodium/potassium/calcium exchanger 6
MNATLFYDIPLRHFILIVGLFSAFVLFIKTKNHTPPSFHLLFSYIGFLISVLWIYSLAQEVVDLIRAIGFMFNLSDAILGLTVLAWGNSLGGIYINFV